MGVGGLVGRVPELVSLLGVPAAPLLLPDVLDHPVAAPLALRGGRSGEHPPVGSLVLVPLAPVEGLVPPLLGALGPERAPWLAELPPELVGAVRELAEGALGGRRAVAPLDPGALLAASQDAIVVLETDGTVVYASPSLARVAGVPPAAVLGRSAFRFVHPADEATVRELFDRLLGSPPATRALRFRVMRPDGGQSDVEAVARVLGEAGRPRGVVANLRSLAEPEILAPTASGPASLLRGVLDALPTGVLVARPDGVVLSVNPAAEGLLGYGREQLVGRDVASLVAAFEQAGGTVVASDGRPLPLEEHPLYASVRSGHSVAATLVGHRGSDGATRWFRMATALVGAPPRVDAVVVTLDDAADEVGRLEQARASGERDRFVLDALSEAVLMVDDASRVLVANAACERAFGIPPWRIEGRTLEELAAALLAAGGGLWRDDGEPLDTAGASALLATSGGHEVVGVVLGLTLPGGGEARWFEVDARPAPTGADGGVATVASVREVTAARRTEAARAAAVAALRRERRLLRVLLDTVSTGILTVDAAGLVTLENAAYRLLLRRGAEEASLGAPPSSAALAWPDGRPLGAGDHPVLRALAEGRAVEEELVVALAAGRQAVRVSARPLRDEDGAVLGAVAAFHPRAPAASGSAARAVGSALAVATTGLRDALTGLPGRALFEDRLAVALERASRERLDVALARVDLDDLAEAGLGWGRDALEALLTAVARRLESARLPGETLARLEGGAFALLTTAAGGQLDAASLRSRLERCLAAPVALGGQQVDLSASIGVALVHGGGAADRLLQEADAALHRERMRRRGRRLSAESGPGPLSTSPPGPPAQGRIAGNEGPGTGAER